MLERDFKKKVQGDLEKRGWVFIQLVAGAGIPKGFPDTLCIAPNGYHCFVEWKKSKNAERKPLQDYWNVALTKMGHDAFFVSPENVADWREKMMVRGDNESCSSL